MKRTAIALLVAILALGTACGDDDEDTEATGQQTPTTAAAGGTTTSLGATSTTAGENRITIQNFAFSGIDNARSAANWTVANSDNVPHTVSAVDGSFRFSVAPGETKTFTQRLAPGSYPIQCDIHPSRMTGTLVVR